MKSGGREKQTMIINRTYRRVPGEDKDQIVANYKGNPWFDEIEQHQNQRYFDDNYDGTSNKEKHTLIIENMCWG